jgi:hypothetical protein
MAMPRSKYVKDGEVGVYHCYTRCVRRAFLCGFDKLSGRDFSHRKVWMVDRLSFLASIFAVDVVSHSVMETHHHNILRTRPDIAAGWSDQEVAIRWLTLYPRRHTKKSPVLPSTEGDISALVSCPERIAVLRKRLSNLSWFMGRLNEHIARAANKEDQVKGRFWESRFKCQALLDDAAIASCMVYIDLNPIRAGLAASPEESDFTSIQERIRTWQQDSVSTLPDNADEISKAVPKHSCWLCPISSILQMTEAEYFDLVDRSGRMVRSDKRGYIDADLAPIILRIGAKPDQWLDTISRFGCKFRLAAGMLSSLRSFANRIGRRWLQGVTTARSAFTL